MKISNVRRTHLIELARQANYSEYDYVIHGCYYESEEEREKYRIMWQKTLTDEAAVKTYRRVLRETIEYGIKMNKTVTADDVERQLIFMIALEA